MPDRSYRKSLIRFLLSTGVVCLLLLVMNRSANATCGDYLSHTGSQDVVGTELSDLPGQIPLELPCTGPQCQNRQPNPIPETPMNVFSSLKPACSDFNEVIISQAQQGTLMNCTTLILPEDHRDRIDRPPQIAGS